MTNTFTKSIVCAIALVPVFCGQAQANDLAKIFDPCAHALSVSKDGFKEIEQHYQQMNSRGEFEKFFRTAMQSVMKETEFKSLTSYGMSESQAEAYINSSINEMLEDEEAYETYYSAYTQKIDQSKLSEIHTLTTQRKELKVDCKTDAVNTTVRVLDNTGEILFTFVPSLLGKDAARTSRDLYDYLTLDKNPLKGIERNWIRRPAKEIERTTERLGKEVERTGERVGKEVERTVKRARKEVERFFKKL